jgi:hypothetical protein
MRMLLVSLLIVVPQTGAAEECPDLGVENAYLGRHFCEQIKGILSQTGKDRSTWPDEDNPPEGANVPPWRSVGMLNEAYSRDPKKTLALIERIKAAGGLDLK